MRLVKWLAITTAAAAVSLAGGAAEQGGEAPVCGGELPPPLAVPAEYELAFALDADGVQVHACGRGAGSYAWALKGPEAALTEGGRAAGTHYAGPTWESTDGSKVSGAKLEAATPRPVVR